MRKLILAASLALLGASPALAQVCLTTSDDVKVCLEVPTSEPKCASGYPAITLIQQSAAESAILLGSTVCVLRAIEGRSVTLPDGTVSPLIAVTSPIVYATGNGSGSVNTAIEAAFFAHQLKAK